MVKKKETPNIKNVTSKTSSRRPPVVAILGHVDHGKTTLLDFIRKSRVTEKEAGGITQHIGAYQIEHKGRRITFIDTPGHEAFSAMRARGGQVSDLVVLIIAADDGVMPQTRESIAHIKAAGAPFIVAINKIDLPSANVERIKKQLSEEGVLVEGFGGDVVLVPISAKSGQGVEDLLEMISLVTDIQELKDTRNEPFRGVVIESKLDKSKGAVATVLVKEGILRLGDQIYTVSSSGKVKALIDAQGRGQKEALPATPVEVLGFTLVPKVGEVVTKTLNLPTDIIEKRVKPDIAEKIRQLAEDETRLIIKADVTGSLEAIIGSLENLKEENHKVEVYYSDTGAITESDVLLAAATRSLIIGFNVSISKSAEKLASEEKVLIRQYQVIYELLDELKEGLAAISKQKEVEEVLGEAEIVNTFKAGEKKIAGCLVKSGRINQTDTVKILREGKVIGQSKVTSMKHKDSVISEARVDDEFGVMLEKEVPFTKGDIIIAIS